MFVSLDCIVFDYSADNICRVRTIINTHLRSLLKIVLKEFKVLIIFRSLFLYFTLSVICTAVI